VSCALCGSLADVVVLIGCGVVLNHHSDTFPEHDLEWPFVYVLTDFCQGTLDSWAAHPQLQEAFAAGILDTALYVMLRERYMWLCISHEIALPCRFNAESDSQMTLTRSGVVLSAEFFAKNDNPAVVICNYVFDTLTTVGVTGVSQWSAGLLMLLVFMFVVQDAFHLIGGDIKQAQVSLMSSSVRLLCAPQEPLSHSVTWCCCRTRIRLQARIPIPPWRAALLDA